MAQRQKPAKQVQEQLCTLSTSLQTCQTLLTTGVGCISFLRGLFPEDAFSSEKLVAGAAPVSHNNPSGSKAHLEKEKDAPSVRVKKLVRGASGEVDKLLDLITIGAMDALQKSWLQQLILGIYLDPEDPSNVVECYTFTFTYEADDRGDKHPEMVVRNQLSGMVISDTSSSFANTPKKLRKPVAENDATRQVQRMIKNLIACTEAMTELPRRRFVSVRLYYTDDCPDDYEPPLFKPVDPQRFEIQLTTASVLDRPDTMKLGSLSTGYHGVTLHAISVVPLLETAYDENISLDEALARNQADALSRPVVWETKSLLASVEDADPKGVRDGNGILHRLTDIQQGGEEFDELKKVVGLEGDGEVIQEVFAHATGDTQDRLWKGNENQILAAASSNKPLSSSNAFDELPATQPEPVISRQQSYRGPAKSNLDAFGIAPPKGLEAVPEAREEEEVEDRMDDYEEQAHAFEDPDYSRAGSTASGYARDDSPSTSSLVVKLPGKQSSPPTTAAKASTPAAAAALSPALASVYGYRSVSTRALVAAERITDERDALRGIWAKEKGKVFQGCECGDAGEDEMMIQCAACEVWKHVVCYGFLSTKDKRIPAGDFFCYPCRVICDSSESILNPVREQEIEDALEKLGSLALFRRAVSVIWVDGLMPPQKFKERLAIDTATSGQIMKRFRAEHFVLDNLKTKQSKQGQLNRTSAIEKYKNDVYFNPGQGAEKGLCAKLDSLYFDEYQPVDQPHVNPDRQVSFKSSPLPAPMAPKANAKAASKKAPRPILKPAPAVAGPSKAFPLAQPPLAIEQLEPDPVQDSWVEEPPLLTPQQAAETLAQTSARKAKKALQDQHLAEAATENKRKRKAPPQPEALKMALENMASHARLPPAATTASTTTRHAPPKIIENSMDVDGPPTQAETLFEPHLAQAPLAPLNQLANGALLNSGVVSKPEGALLMHQDGVHDEDDEHEMFGTPVKKAKCSEGDEIEV